MVNLKMLYNVVSVSAIVGEFMKLNHSKEIKGLSNIATFLY